MLMEGPDDIPDPVFPLIRDRPGSVAFFVAGVPAPGGSKKAVPIGGGKVALVDDAKRNGPWRERVAAEGQAAMGDGPLLDGPLALSMRFVVARPKGHFGTGKNAGTVKASAPRWPAVKPDATKLLRAAEDALSGVIWHDDARIVRQFVAKDYGARPGVLIAVVPMEG